MNDGFIASLSDEYETADAKFMQLKIDGSISPFIEIFGLLVKQCNHVTEFGVGSFSSTVVFIASGAKKLVSYDFRFKEVPSFIKKLCKEVSSDFKFIQADTLNLKIEPTDLLFIDTQHTYSQLLAELRIHSKNVRKYIVCHDTYLFRYKGEDLPKEADYKNCPYADIKGLADAINEFLDEEEKAEIPVEWKIIYDSIVLPGLTVLERKN